MKLIQMTEFVLQQEERLDMLLSEHLPTLKMASSYDKVINYAKFLCQPITLGMFIPVDENGNVLEEPRMIERSIGFDEKDVFWDVDEVEIYRKAKEKVLFEGVKIKHRENYFILDDKDGTWIRVIKNNTSLKVEDLLKMSSVELTPSGLKQIGL